MEDSVKAMFCSSFIDYTCSFLVVVSVCWNSACAGVCLRVELKSYRLAVHNGR